MDIVYPYKSAPDDFELRYSLRSLANIRHKMLLAGPQLLFGKSAAMTFLALGLLRRQRRRRTFPQWPQIWISLMPR